MEQEKFDCNWFRNGIVPLLENFEIKERFFENGDLGSLCGIEFNSDKVGGVIHFWGQGYLEIYLLEFASNIELINVLLSKDESDKKKMALKKLLMYLLLE